VPVCVSSRHVLTGVGAGAERAHLFPPWHAGRIGVIPRFEGVAQRF
jgi:hypothetical protein